METNSKPEEIVRLHCAGSFGILRVVGVTTDGFNPDFLCIVAHQEDGTTSHIITHVSQCAFLFSTAPKTPEPKPTIGFLQPNAA
jgi:hypothetical protein